MRDKGLQFILGPPVRHLPYRQSSLQNLGATVEFRFDGPWLRHLALSMGRHCEIEGAGWVWISSSLFLVIALCLLNGPLLRNRGVRFLLLGPWLRQPALSTGHLLGIECLNGWISSFWSWDKAPCLIQGPPRGNLRGVGFCPWPLEHQLE